MRTAATTRAVPDSFTNEATATSRSAAVRITAYLRLGNADPTVAACRCAREVDGTQDRLQRQPTAGQMTLRNLPIRS
jgi:hypothetical protein